MTVDSNHDSPAPAAAPPYRYVLITPARNEAAFIELTLRSVTQQLLPPVKWIIVSDGSTDGTDEMVAKYAAQHPWIELIRMPERAERHFGGKVHAFNAGYARVKDLDYEVLGNLDGDISFGPDYFEFLMKRFAENPQLGVGGTPYREGTKMYDYRFMSVEHVSGACQMFRRECFEDIGGYRPMKSGGIDLVAVLSARAKGWKTRTFTEMTCEHHRGMGASHHTGFRERIHRGRMDYLLGSHPVWELFRGIFQTKNKPYVIGGFLIIYGYVATMFSGRERTMPKELMQLRRREQMHHLKKVVLRGFGLSRGPEPGNWSPRVKPGHS